MTKNTESIMLSLIRVMQMKNSSLTTVELCANAIAADARFNRWICHIGKKELSEVRLIEAAEIIDDIYVNCKNAIAAFELSGDNAVLERFLREMAKQLEDMMH